MNSIRKKLQTIQKPAAIILGLLSFGFLTQAQTPDPAPSPKQLTGVVAVEAYCKELDSFKKRNPNKARWFGDVASWDRSGMTLNEPPAKWQEFKGRKARESAANGDNLFEVADVWMRDDKVVIAEYGYSSPSGDWSKLVTYYFRDDGSLAKMRSTYATFNINPFADPEEFGARLVQTRIYDASGKRLQKRLQCFELDGKRRQRKCSGDYTRYEGEVYRTVQSMPVYRLLNAGSRLALLNDVASIESYRKSLDAFMKRRPDGTRIFGNIVSPNQETYPVPPTAPRYWEEFPGRKAREAAPKGYDFYDGVAVWTREGEVVIADIELNRTNVSADRRAIHYFRPDGTLAKTYNQVFMVDYHIINETTYDKEGKILQGRTRCFDTSGRGPGKVVKCPQALLSELDLPVYLKVNNLPLYGLLKSK